MREITYAAALGEALAEEMELDPSVTLLGEDIGRYGGIFGVTRGLLDRFGPERVLDTPISETGFIGCAVGASLTGLRPVVEVMYIDFTLVAADAIINQAAKLRYMTGGQVSVPLVLRTQQGGGRGNAAQHSQSLEALYAHIPGLKVALPATPADAKGLLKTAIRGDDPVVFIEHKLLYGMRGPVPDGEHLVPFGQACVQLSGADVTVVATSRSVLHALTAAERLAREDISVEVIDPRTLVPFDAAAVLDSVAKTHRAVLVQEAPMWCGAAASIAALIQEQAFDELDAPVTLVTGAPTPVPYSEPLEAAVLPGPDDIVAAVRKVVA